LLEVRPEPENAFRSHKVQSHRCENSKAMMVIGFMAYRRKSKTALMAVIDDNEI
jgi:hypothetical protein